MIIKNITENLNFNNIKYNAINGGDNESEVSNPCKCSIIIMGSSIEETNVIISADIIWFTEELVNNIRKKINFITNIIESRIVFCASHTHGSPNPDPNIHYGKKTENIHSYLEKKLFSLFKRAFDSEEILVDANFQVIKAPDLSINRRRKAIQFKEFPYFKTQSLPNKYRYVDNKINIIRFVRLDNKKIENAIIAYSCHPVADPQGIVGADYPGYLRNYLKDKMYHNIIFLQGFCGDIRPNVIKKNKSIKDKFIKLVIGDRFRKIKHGDAEYISKNLSKAIINNKPLIENTKIESLFKSKVCKLQIPLNNNCYANKKLEVTIWLWGGICFIFMSAEVLSGYTFTKIDGLNIINVGYSNGMIGYLPTKLDIYEGGYEVDKSRPPFGLNNRISLKAEKMIKDKIYNEIKKLNN